MSERESFDAHLDAIRGLAARERMPHHQRAIRTYVAELAYAVTQRRAAAERDEPQPVDAPAPPVGPRR